jgi:hypothetical protein
MTANFNEEIGEAVRGVHARPAGITSRITQGIKETTLNRKVISFTAAMALAMTSPAAIAFAQAPVRSETQRAAAGPTVAASAVGIRRAAPARVVNAPAAEARLGAGRNVAMMVVGGAALIIGAVIGGTAGVLIAVAGAAIGLYGLYNFVQ